MLDGLFVCFERIYISKLLDAEDGLTDRQKANLLQT